MRKSLGFAIAASILTTLIVMIAPVNVSHSEPVSSPYREEIDRLLEEAKRGVPSDKSESLSDLIAKNNKWFEYNRTDPSEISLEDAVITWQRKSTYLSPILILIWVSAYYIAVRNTELKWSPNAAEIWIVAFPIILGLIQLLSLLSAALIVVAILILRAWLVLGAASGSREDPPSA